MVLYDHMYSMSQMVGERGLHVKVIAVITSTSHRGQGCVLGPISAPNGFAGGHSFSKRKPLGSNAITTLLQSHMVQNFAGDRGLRIVNTTAS